MKDSNNLTVFTLGQFDVIREGRSLIKASKGSRKIWELFKFMLTHRDRSFTPESLMNQLWVSEEYSDPRSVIRKQMHRLRKALGEETADDDKKTILFSNGYYRWNEQVSIKLDAELFETYIKNGDEQKKNSPEAALQSYKEALNIYAGDYLPDCTNQYWVYAIRNHFRKQYIKAVSNVIELLKPREAYDEIIVLCQKAIQIDMYEEVFHISLLDTLIAKGDFRQAFEYYEYITEFYKKEMGIKPSDEMRIIHKKLMESQAITKVDNNFCEILEVDDSYENALYCEPEVFKVIYEMERRRSQRQNTVYSVGVITVNPIRGYTHSQNELRMNRIKQLLLERLRKEDAITLWDYHQFAVLLPGANEDITEDILKRALAPEKEDTKILINQLYKLPSFQCKTG